MVGQFEGKCGVLRIAGGVPLERDGDQTSQRSRTTYAPQDFQHAVYLKSKDLSKDPARLDDDVRQGYTEPGSIARQIPLCYTSTSINLPNFSFGLGVEQKIFRQRFCVSRRRPAAGSRT